MMKEEYQIIIDNEHMRLLSLFYYINGGLTMAFSCLFIFHFLFMLAFASNPEILNSTPEMDEAARQNQEYIFRAFTIILGFFIFAGISFGALTIYVGTCIKNRARRILTMIIAGLNCLLIPYGTILGVFTFIVLSRDSVKKTYHSNKSLQPGDA